MNRCLSIEQMDKSSFNASQSKIPLIDFSSKLRKKTLRKTSFNLDSSEAIKRVLNPLKHYNETKGNLEAVAALDKIHKTPLSNFSLASRLQFESSSQQQPVQYENNEKIEHFILNQDLSSEFAFI